ncbi:MAG: peptide chain release factor 2 [Candidatus Dojkabacteria bacterium]
MISKKDITQLEKKLSDITESLDIPSKKDTLDILTRESKKENLWKDQKNAQKILSDINEITEEIEKVERFKNQLFSLQTLLEETSEEEISLLEEEYWKLKKEIEEFEILKFLSNKYDKAGAILSIHSGQGGTEAEDWARMLLRMYTMYIEKRGWQYTTVNIAKGSETGISTATLNIPNRYAYGMLKKEHGVHRLVRLSPFNAQNLRQTSFAAVEVVPILEELDDEIEIPPSDIEFKAVRSAGPGGQNVNKTSTAVQITHTPTNIVVHCSERRSQLENRERAMQILKGKLWKILEENRLKEISEIKGDYKIAGWGNQIRNYILHPYKLVKDLRTGVESSTPERVLDGDLDKFLEAEVRIQ